MTDTPARQPQQEYIITWEQLNLLYHADAGVSPYEPNNPDDTFEYPIPEVKPILDAIRSRPRTSPPAPTGTLPCPELIEVETEPGLKEWVCRATIPKAPSPFEKSCFGKIAICPCDDECYTVKDCQKFFDTIVANRKDAAKAAREQVLKGILMAMNDPQLVICDTGYQEHAYWRDYIKSLRAQQQGGVSE